MIAQIKILVIYPLLHQNAPDTTIVWVTEFTKLFRQIYSQLFQLELELEITSLPTETSDFESFVQRVANYNHVFAIQSPEFLKNEKYIEYLKRLYDQTQARKAENGSGLNIYNIVRKPVLNTINEEWLLDFPFFNLFEKSSGIRGFKAIDFSQKIEDDSNIWEKLIDLAHELNKHIVLSKHNQPDKVTIFLAETTSDQELFRDKVERELKHRGFRVLPETPLPANLDILKSKLNDMVLECDLTIHIMGGVYGDYLKSGAYSLIDFQNRIVREVIEKGLHRKSLNRIIWIPPYLKIQDQRQELFLRRLKREETDEYTEIIQAPLEDLKSTIGKTLRRKKKTDIEEKHVGKYVYIIHDFKRTELLPEVKAIFKENGLDSLLLDFNIDNIVEAHFNHLKNCHGVLIIHNGFEPWLNSKLNDLKKVWGYGRKKPFEIMAVLLQEKDYQTLFKRDFGDVLKLIYQEGILDKTLQPFINLVHADENSR